jgi:hypothetical protein
MGLKIIKNLILFALIFLILFFVPQFIQKSNILDGGAAKFGFPLVYESGFLDYSQGSPPISRHSFYLGKLIIDIIICLVVSLLLILLYNKIKKK